MAKKNEQQSRAVTAGGTLNARPTGGARGPVATEDFQRVLTDKNGPRPGTPAFRKRLEELNQRNHAQDPVASR